MANPIMALLDEHLGRGLGHRLDDPALWDQVLTLDHAELWDGAPPAQADPDATSSARRRGAASPDEWKEAAQVVGAGTLLDPDALTIGFARRFATYKRANLIFRDLERLRRLLVDPRRPVQIIFAGKAHPADKPGKEVLQSVYQFTRDPELRGAGGVPRGLRHAPGAPAGAGRGPLAQPAAGAARGAAAPAA